MRKTLDEYMAQAKDDVIYFVGANSGFFFIGTKAEYYRDIHTISQKYLSSATKSLTRASNEVDRLTKNPPKPTNDLVAYADLLLAYAKRLKSNARKKNTWGGYLATYEPMQERMVRETYHRIEKDGVAVIVTGLENGRYWLREEYINAIPILADEDEEEIILNETL